MDLRTRKNGRKPVFAAADGQLSGAENRARSADCTGNCTGTRRAIAAKRALHPVKAARYPRLLAAGCGLSAGEFGSRCIAGCMRCPAGRTAAVLSGSVARAVCAGQSARGSTAFWHGISGSRPCGQPFSGTGAFCPWASDDLWQHDVVRFGQRAAYGTALCGRRVENDTSGLTLDRPARGSGKRLSMLFRSLCFAGQQPYPRLFFS